MQLFLENVTAPSFRRPSRHLLTALGIGLIFGLVQAVATKAQEQRPANVRAKGPGYDIKDLGKLATIAADVTVSLNNDGFVAYWTRVDDFAHATLWHDGVAVSIESIPGYPNSIAHAINRQGDVAGWMNTSENPVDSFSTTRGFVRLGGHSQILPTLGGRDSSVFAMNDKGSVVGNADLPTGTSHAFLFSGSRMLDLGTLPSGTSSTAYAINNDGWIAGAADVKGQFNHAVLWRDRKIQDLGTLPGGTTSSARAINERGQIVGFSDSPDGVHAFLYEKGAMRDLGTLGNDPSEASGINRRGDIVGASNVTGTKRRAFLWHDGRMTDLNSFLPEDSEWLLVNAFSVNDRGQIACAARRKGGPNHLVLLTPLQGER